MPRGLARVRVTRRHGCNRGYRKTRVNVTQQESEPYKVVQPAAAMLLPAGGEWPVEPPSAGHVVWRGPSGGVSITVATTTDAVWVAVHRAGVRPGVLDALGWWLSEALAARFIPDVEQADPVLQDAAVAASGADLTRDRVVGWVGGTVATVSAARRILCALALGIRAAGAGSTVGPLIAAWASDARAPDPGGWLGLVTDDGLWAQGQQQTGPEGIAALWVEALTGRWLLVSPASTQESLDPQRLATRAGVPVHMAPPLLGDAARAWHARVTGQTPGADVYLLDAALAPADWQERVADRVLRYALHAAWVPAPVPGNPMRGLGTPAISASPTATAAASPYPTTATAHAARDSGGAPLTPAWEWVGPPPATERAPQLPAEAVPSLSPTAPPLVEQDPDGVPAHAEAKDDPVEEAPADIEPGEPVPAADDADRFDVQLVDAGPDLARTATLLVAALGVQRTVADAWCAALPAQIASDIDAARVRRLDTLVRAGATATLRIVRRAPSDAG